MKNFKITTLLILLISIISVACKKDIADSRIAAANIAKAKTETASFEISGMTCAIGCAKSIENKLSDLEGVEKATVDFDKKTASVQYNAALQTPETLVTFVEAVADGKTYKVSNVKSSADKAMLYQDTPKQEKRKAKNAKKTSEEYSTTSSTVSNNLVVTPTAEKKPACCSAKKACSEKPSVL